MMAVAVLVLAAGVALAQCGGPVAPMQGGCGMTAAPAAGSGCGGGATMVASAQAVYDGYTYVFTGTTLEKRRSCGMVVKSVAVDCEHECAAQAANTGERDVEGGFGTQTPGTRACPASGAATGGGCGMAGAGGGCGMMAGGQGRGPKLAADAEGVTLRCCGQTLSWDLELNAREVAASAGCPMMGGEARGMQRAGCAGCGMMSWDRGPSDERGLAGGVAALQVRPCHPRVGTVSLRLTVSDTELQPDGDAAVTVFLYPSGRPEVGHRVELPGTEAGVSQGAVQFEQPGVWELAVRVTRPDVADEVIYYLLDVK